MSKILTAKEVRTEIYVYNTLQVDAVRFNDNGNILIADGEEAASCCLNCANPRCMFINEEASQCTKFHDIAGKCRSAYVSKQSNQCWRTEYRD